MTGERVLGELPKHRAHGAEGYRGLSVEGLVREPLVLDAAALAKLPQTDLTEDFTCEEGWRVPEQAWSGVRVASLLDAAGILEEGRWVEFAAGDFCFSVLLEDAKRAIVALNLNGEPLTREHGGPVRLLLPGGACFTSIKWLDRIEVRPNEGPDRAAAIARGRLSAGSRST